MSFYFHDCVKQIVTVSKDATCFLWEFEPEEDLMTYSSDEHKSEENENEDTKQREIETEEKDYDSESGREDNLLQVDEGEEDEKNPTEELDEKSLPRGSWKLKEKWYFNRDSETQLKVKDKIKERNKKS